jgi:surfeit locus 1 family protein
VLKLLRTPRWVIATIVVVVVCGVFVSLGNWQLRRHQERAVENTVIANRLANEPQELDVVLTAAGPDLDSLTFRPVIVTGRFDPEREILVRSQVAADRAGFHVVTPLITENDATVLVNRGWVPLAVERPPVESAAPPSGEVTVEGLARATQQRPIVGPTEPDGVLTVVARIDLERLSEQFSNLVPVWVQQTGTADGPLPIPLDVPATDDPGPHLPYAVQWYSFAIIGVVGFGFLMRRAARTAT